MNRRGFLKTCLALAAAPAIVRAENIMRIWTPPQEIIPAWTNEFFAPQLEHANMALNNHDFIGSVWSRSVGGKWMHQQITIHADAAGVLPIMRLDRNGLSVESGGKVVGKYESETHASPEEFARVTLSDKPDAHITLGDQKGIRLHGASVSLPCPTDRPVRYPLITNMNPVYDDDRFAGTRRVVNKTEPSNLVTGLLERL